MEALSEIGGEKSPEIVSHFFSKLEILPVPHSQAQKLWNNFYHLAYICLFHMIRGRAIKEILAHYQKNQTSDTYLPVHQDIPLRSQTPWCGIVVIFLSSKHWKQANDSHILPALPLY